MRYRDNAIDGTGDLLSSWLQELLPSATTLGIRTGFLTMEGVDFIALDVERILNSGGKVVIVVGGHDEQSDPEALEVLRQIVAKHPNMGMLRIVCEPHDFSNAKTYYLETAASHAYALVGSPNLTRGGLETNVEAALTLDSGTDDPEALAGVWDGIQAAATEEFSIPVTARVIERLGGTWRRSKSRSQARESKQAAAPSTPLSDGFEPAFDRIVEIGASPILAALPTGFGDLDRLLSGFHAGQVIVVGARLGCGKSTLVMDFARHMALHHGIPVGFFSLEQSRDEVMLRLLSAETRVPLHVLQSGDLSDDDWTRLAKRTGDISAAPLLLNHTPRLDIKGLTDAIAELADKYAARLIVVDSLSLLNGNRDRERYTQVTEIMRELKHAARSCGVAIVVTAQVKAPQGRFDKRPSIDDLAESESIAQVADVIILLHREDYYDKESPRGGEADLIVAKHRNGATDTITVAAQLHLSRFVDMAA
ncbi:DnaB-like helicase C-terminal domain-containing protein [Glycomyces paridis]|nr:DnaB-like helicase C-terminal domain-containing protein [Glycomyces paridis]